MANLISFRFYMACKPKKQPNMVGNLRYSAIEICTQKQQQHSQQKARKKQQSKYQQRRANYFHAIRFFFY